MPVVFFVMMMERRVTCFTHRVHGFVATAVATERSNEDMERMAGVAKREGEANGSLWSSRRSLSLSLTVA